REQLLLEQDFPDPHARGAHPNICEGRLPGPRPWIADGSRVRPPASQICERWRPCDGTTFAYTAHVRVHAVPTFLAVLALHCASPDATAPAADAVKTPERDWEKNPAVVQIDDADEIYAVSDVHGHYKEFVELLAANGVIKKAPSKPADVEWSAGTAILVL